MPSPFPGVDPYLEDQHYWPDFHSRFNNAWSEVISEALPATYEARIEEQIQIIEHEPEKARIVRPDVAVVRPTEFSPGSQARRHTVGAVATLDAITLPFPIMEEVNERWIQIFHRPDRSLVAVLELLSPTNKRNPGRGQYLSKRSDLYIQDVHLVELDLLLVGQRLPMGKPLPPGDYYAIIARADKRPQADVYTWSMRDRLPVIPIPLLKPDKDIFIDLANVFALAYERGRYAQSIKYSAALEMPLEPEIADWAAAKAKDSQQNR